MKAKRLLCFLLALALGIACAAPALAADEDEEHPVRVIELSHETLTLRVNRTRMLFAELLPKRATDQSVYWSSSNREVATVDGEGIVRGISPGTATITAEAGNGKKAACVVTVSDLVLTTLVDQGKPQEDIVANTGELLTASELLSATSAAISEGRPVISFENKTSLSKKALAGAANAAGYRRGRLTLRFDTMGKTGSVQGRLQFDAADGAQDIRLAVYTTEEQTGAVREKFESFFGKRVAVILCGQSGSFGMTVEITAKPDLTGLDSAMLRFYSYDIAENTYLELTPENWWVDANGYLHLTTTYGGAVLITN